MSLTIQRNRIALLHISFWCIYLSFSFYEISFHASRHGDYNWARVLFFALFEISSLLVIAYLNYFFFLPRWLKSKKIWKYLLEFLIPFCFIIFSRIHLQRFLADGYTHKMGYLYSNLFTVQVISTTLFIVIFVSMLRFAAEWFEFEAKKKEVENEKLTAELNFLKAQINPHFLFNTLNNLYYLAYSKSDNTTEVIAKLSQIMRYMIYDSNYEKVVLSKEIEAIENYISLERLRLNNEIPINFKIVGNSNSVYIAPLILITFIENAFKHGVNNSKEAWVNILIEIKDRNCIYKVENSISNKNKGGKPGIGLQNVKRRLELSYPKQYNLNIDEGAEKYSVELILNLN